MAFLVGGGLPLSADTPGRDGLRTVAAAGTVVNGYSKVLTGNAAAVNATHIDVTSTAALTCLGCSALAAGDLLLIYQAQGAQIGTADAATYGAVSSLGNAGHYEFMNVVSVQNSTQVNISQCTTPTNVGLRYAYNDVAQVIRVPQYSTVTINAGSSIVATPWDGSIGGVVAMTVNGAVTNNGTIDVSGRGFRGAPRVTTAVATTCPTCITTFRSPDATGATGAQKGEGIAGLTSFASNDYGAYYDANGGRYGRGAPANAGGGADSHNSGGGGGANGDTGQTWTGYGLRPSGNDTTWALETAANSTPGPPANWTTLASGGGRGGYSWSSNNVSPTLPANAPGSATWAGDNRREVGGRGGHPVTNNPAGGVAFIGGGGGAGHANDNNGGAGGAGGGLVIILAGGAVNGGSILANGAPGGAAPNSAGIVNNDAPGGAGAGGTIILQAVTMGSTTLSANGGAGGNQTPTSAPNAYEVEGPGGGGGGGYIATGGYVYGTVTRLASGGVGGTTSIAPMTAFPPNGATSGAAGQAAATFGPGLLPICTALTTLPVSLSWFHASPGPRGAHLEWETTVEAGNVGFNLYGEVDGEMVLLNPELIPGQAVSRLETSTYAFEAQTDATIFWLEEVGLAGETRGHGPFGLDREAGVRDQSMRVDWEGVHRESAEKEMVRASDAVVEVRKTASRSVLGNQASNQGLTVPIRLLVDREGMFRVTYEALKAAGFETAGISTSKLVLTNQGVAVPIWLGKTGTANTDSGVFGPGSFLVFWGLGIKSLYTNQNVYELTTATAGGRGTMGVDSRTVNIHLPPVTSYQETVSYDRNVTYSFSSPSGDPWYETRLLAYKSPVQATYSLDVADLAPGTGGQLKVDLWGSTDWPQSPDHHVIVRWNGQNVADKFADGIVNLPLSISLGAAQLRNGANQLDVVLPGDSGVDYELMMVDTYGVTYPRLFRARQNSLTFTATSGPFAVEGFTTPDVYVFRKTAGSDGVDRLVSAVTEAWAGGFRAHFGDATTSRAAGDRYQVTTGAAFLSPVIEAGRMPLDLSHGDRVQSLIVAHPDFVSGVEPLAAARRARGVSVRVLDVRDVYELYTGGVVDPSAITQLVRDARKRWGTRSLLIVGGDTYDYFNYLGLGSKSFVPTLYAKTDPVVVRYAPADALFGDVNENGVPEVAVGRLPVRTSSELAIVIAKTLGWKGVERIVLAADQSDPNLSFSELSNRIAVALPPALPAIRAYIDELGLAGARAALLPAMNQGNALVNFLGHSSYSRWSFAGLFLTSDVAALTNAGRPLVVNQFGCWNNYFVDPTYSTLGHVLLLSGDRGAAAAFGTATLSDVSSEAILGPILAGKLMEKGKSIGQALVEAKAAVDKVAPNRPDIQIGMTLLGDPELVLVP